jgi:hypothetical protein
MLKNVSVFVIALLCVLAAAQAQTTYPGTVKIHQDPRIPALLNKHIHMSKAGRIDGYRVQIFFDSGTNSKNRAAGKKGQFAAMYSRVSAYLTWDAPNYKVRVGDFRTRMDAEGFKAKIIESFPDAFVVRDNINYPDL